MTIGARIRPPGVSTPRAIASRPPGERDRIRGSKTSLDVAAEPERPALLGELIGLEVELRRGRGEQPTPGEYRDRFPGQFSVVDAAFAETALRPESSRPRPSPNRENTSRNLLFGLLALQNNFIGRDDLLAAFAAWVADTARAPGPAPGGSRGASTSPPHAAGGPGRRAPQAARR